ncbi:MAG: hypothetical protein Q4B01_00620 [Eubacteriales bacterium]|nr:hypothetical protein [Eubacteriales bacterium]
MEKNRKQSQAGAYWYRQCPFGASRESGGIRFTAEVPRGAEASLILYPKDGSKPAQEISFPQQGVVGNVRSMLIPKLAWRNYNYNYCIDGEVCPDPYARVISGREHFGVFIQNDSGSDVQSGLYFNQFDWKDDQKPEIPWEDVVMYHLHVRNYTMQKKSSVRRKGTFAGLQEKIPYLKKLGINQVKLMPITEFEEFIRPAVGYHPTATKVPFTDLVKLNCWGYQDSFCFAPKAGYASGKDAVKECKQMIREFHRAGIEVLLDFYFSEEIPLTTIIDCLTFWMIEYHVDGFHVFGREEVIRVLTDAPQFADTKLICSGYSDMDLRRFKEGEGYQNKAEMNDGFLIDIRQILKGDEGMVEKLAWRTRRKPEQYGLINYLTNHDGFTMRDLVSYDGKHNEENGEQNQDGSEYNFSWNCGEEGETRKKKVRALRMRQEKNAWLLLLLSQGTPMLTAGDEIGNSQKGNNNPYCLDTEISWVDWSIQPWKRELLEFVKKAIAFRREHGVLHQKKEPRCMDYQAYGCPDLSYHGERAWYGNFSYQSRKLGALYCGKYADDDEYIYVLYNFHAQPQEMALPFLKGDLKWYLLADTSREESFPETEELFADSREKTCMIAERSIVILKGRGEKDESDRTL